MQIKVAGFIIIFTLIFVHFTAADEMSMFLGEPMVNGSYSEQEQEFIARSLHGKITTALISQPDVLLIGDREIEALLEEAERRASLNCDTDECFAMISQMLDTDYVVRCEVSPEGSTTVTVQLWLQERSGQALSTRSYSEAGNIDPFNERELNWYSSELVTKLFDQTYEIQAYRGGVNFEVVFEDQERIQVEDIQRERSSRTLSIEDVEIQDTRDEVEIQDLDLPEVSISFTNDDVGLIADSLWERVRAADRLVEAENFDSALSSYTNIYDQVDRISQEYSEIGEFREIITNRVLEARRFQLSLMIQEADRIEPPAQRLDEYFAVQSHFQNLNSETRESLGEEEDLLEQRISGTRSDQASGILS
ncbi:MAG: hypothetical protein ACLFR1_05775, partial [Spirochaetia bacterium]